ncbi:hypothetical protein B0T16DRAFT_488584 [Cercophora newfieldiana]|uniref:Complex 1 LYR protein domain-containing protein n=1 Tax=Cercophora newfieldiana TaxID=92897 RepID=A0AA39YRV5_9PEZI|nr:hypothetical protein B0T16DRAFT_488584 [Cercophora newfieldiana]
MRLSGLQKEILSLYRQCLRECRKKPEATRSHFQAFARNEFSKNIAVDKRDFAAIEFLLRKGRRQLEIPSLAHRAAEEVMHKPLSESLQKLRRAQRALVRRKHRSRVRVSFTHSTSSRGSKAVAPKTTSRSLKPSEAQPIPLAVPDRLQGVDIKSTVKLEKDRGPYPVFGRQEGPVPLDDACCHSSPPEHYELPKTGLEKSGQRSGSRPGENRAFWGILPKSPVRSPPKPEALRAPQSATPDHARVGNLDEKLHSGQPAQPRESNIKRRPLPAVPATPRYSVFPKPITYTQRVPTMTITPLLNDPVHSESVRRSLSQQHRLSSLVPSDDSSTLPKANRLEQRCPVSPPVLTVLPASSQNTKTSRARSSSRQKRLDTFTRELEEYVIAAGAVGKLPASTSSGGETHVSVHTVKEFLPYRQQFREAGLAVTSTDQKARARKEASPPSQNGTSDAPRLKPDEKSSSGQEFSSGDAKESSSETVIHFRTPKYPKPLAQIQELPQKPEKADPKPWINQPSESSHQQTSEAPTVNSGPGESCAAVRREVRRRPSGVLLMNKPLPAKPSPTQPKDQGCTKVTTENPQVTGCPEANITPAARRHPPPTASEGSQTVSETHITARSTTPQGSSKVLPSLTAVPAPRKSSQARQGIVLPSKTSWLPAVQQPTTIVEEREPSPERQKTPVNKRCIVRQQDGVVMEVRSRDNNATQATTESRSSAICKPELPETWKCAISTPSSFEKALDDVVRKLEDMGDKAGASPKKERPTSKRASAKPPSPSQRLQRVTALRRQRLAEAAVQGLETTENPISVPVVIPARNPMRRSESSRRAAKSSSAEEEPQVHAPEDEDISDRDVLKGLKIICAASADTELDAWIRAKTGLRLRRFLADLKTFESLSQDGIAALDDRRARRRRSERRRMQAERDSRVRESRRPAVC